MNSGKFRLFVHHKSTKLLVVADVNDTIGHVAETVRTRVGEDDESPLALLYAGYRLHNSDTVLDCVYDGAIISTSDTDPLLLANPYIQDYANTNAVAGRFPPSIPLPQPVVNSNAVTIAPTPTLNSNAVTIACTCTPTLNSSAMIISATPTPEVPTIPPPLAVYPVNSDSLPAAHNNSRSDSQSVHNDSRSDSQSIHNDCRSDSQSVHDDSRSDSLSVGNNNIVPVMEKPASGVAKTCSQSLLMDSETSNNRSSLFHERIHSNGSLPTSADSDIDVVQCNSISEQKVEPTRTSQCSSGDTTYLDSSVTGDSSSEEIEVDSPHPTTVAYTANNKTSNAPKVKDSHRPSASTHRPSSTTHRPSATTHRPSTTTYRPSTITSEHNTLKQSSISTEHHSQKSPTARPVSNGSRYWSQTPLHCSTQLDPSPSSTSADSNESNDSNSEDEHSSVSVLSALSRISKNSIRKVQSTDAQPTFPKKAKLSFSNVKRRKIQHTPLSMNPNCRLAPTSREKFSRIHDISQEEQDHLVSLSNNGNLSQILEESYW